MEESMQEDLRRLVDRADIEDVVADWALYRDQEMWDELRETFHPEGTISVTWFSGPFTDFLAQSAAVAAKTTSPSKHFMGRSHVRISRDRALAETHAFISSQASVDGAEAVGFSFVRFFDRLERRNARWRILGRAAVYEVDRLAAGSASPPGPSADPELLAEMPAAYRYLGYRLARSGRHIDRRLPVNGSPALDELRRSDAAWLAAPGAG